MNAPLRRAARISSERPRIRLRRLVLIIVPLVAVELIVLRIAFSSDRPAREHVLKPPASSLSTTSQSTTKPELILQTGHGLRVDGLAFSPDGLTLATGSADSAVKLWDTATGNELRVLAGHKMWVKAVAFSPDGQRLVSGSVDGSVKIWEVSTGRELLRFDGCGSVSVVAFSPGGRLVAVGNMENQIRLLDATAGRELKILNGNTGWVTALAFSPDDKLLANGSDDRKVRVWDVEAGRPLYTLGGHAARVRSVAFSPDGLQLASGGADSKIKLWDVGAGRGKLTLTGHTSAVIALGFTADGLGLSSLGSERAVKLWDLATGREARGLRDNSGTDAIEAGAFNPDQTLLALSTGDKTVRLWNLKDAGNEARTLSSSISGVYATVFSPDGKFLATGGKDHVINLWEVATGREILSLKGHTGLVTALAFSRDSVFLVSGSEDDTIRVWDAQSGQELRRWTGHEGGVFALALSRDGSALVSGGADQTVKLWDVATAREARRFIGHSDAVTAVNFGPDDRRLVTGGADGSLKVWEAETGRENFKLTGHAQGVTSVAFSPDGRWLASGSTDHAAKIWDANSGAELQKLEGHADWINTVAFSPDSRRLATGSKDHTVRLWDVATWREAHSLSGHTDHVNAVAFSPDARWLVSGSEDGSARLWDAGTGDLFGALVSLRDGDGWLVVSPTGHFDGSPNAWQKILWRFEQNTFSVRPVEVFFNDFYYPGLLGAMFRKQMPITPRSIAQYDRRQPTLKISLAEETAAGAGVVQKREINVRVEVVERAADGKNAAGSGARDVRLFRNGALVKVWRGDLKLDSAGRAMLETTLPVVAGENRLTAYAFNRDNIKSSDAVLRLTGAETLRRKGTAYIITVGLNKYSNSHFNLKYAVSDAEDFGAELKRAQTKLADYGDVRVIPVLDEEATKANILAKLDWLAGVTQPEDTVVFFFAGHGVAYQSQFFLLPYDLPYGGERKGLDERSIRLTKLGGISDAELEKSVEGIMAGRLILVIDACNSGQALEAQEWRRGPMNSKGLAQLAYEKGMFILTAAQSYQAALEVTKLGHGLLTHTLINRGLMTGAADFAPKDGQILLREWLDFAATEVPRAQLSMMNEGRGFKNAFAFVEGEENIDDVRKRSLQRPRVFYRSEVEARSFVIAKIAPAGAGN
jgi:WD40 repeat protein